jgi:hypothetical protein
MLRRPPTSITLSADDIEEFDDLLKETKEGILDEEDRYELFGQDSSSFKRSVSFTSSILELTNSLPDPKDKRKSNKKQKTRQ